MGRRKNLIGALNALLPHDDPRPSRRAKMNIRADFAGYQKQFNKQRKVNGWQQVNVWFKPDEAAMFIWLMKAWGIDVRGEMVKLALKYLYMQTRQGLNRIDFPDIFPDGEVRPDDS